MRWLRGALASRCWVRRMGQRILSAGWREHRPAGNQMGRSGAVGVRTWATVGSGLLPAMQLVELGREEVGDATEDQLPQNRAELPHLEMVHPQFPLAVLEQPLDLPPAEGHQEQLLGRVFSGALLMKYLMVSGSRTPWRTSRLRVSAIA